MNLETGKITILLDLDGTLTDPFPGISASIIYALQKMKLPVPEKEELHAWIGPPLLISFREYFDLIGVNKDEHEALAFYREWFGDRGLFENDVYAGTEAVLAEFLEAGHRMFLATAKPVVYARKIVAHFGLDRFLAESYGAELDGRRTDKTELMQYMIDNEDLNPVKCVMVGDRRHDMIAAKNHGMKAIGVLWGYGSKQELLEAGADVLVDRPEQLLTQIQSDT